MTSVSAYVEGLVYPSARREPLVADRHRAFIAPRLAAGLAAAALLPVQLALSSSPGAADAVMFAALLGPILAAYYLSRTGRYERACLLSAGGMAGMVGLIAAWGGGLNAVAAAWLMLVPVEAAGATSARSILWSAAAAVVVALSLLLGGSFGLLPAAAPPNSLATDFGLVAAIVYGATLALFAQSFGRASVRLIGEEETRYQLLAMHMTDVIIRHGRGGAVSFVSPAAERILDAPLRELQGHGLFDRVHVADRPAYLSAIADAAGRGGARTAEFRIRRGTLDREQGRPADFLWVELRCRALEDTPPQAEPQVVSVLRDISERKRQEFDLLQARSEAERANAAKSRFLATMSHELRTPLNAIIGFSEMLANERTFALDPQRRAEYAQLINDSGQHLLSVVNGILDLSKLEAGHFAVTPEPFAPAPVLKSCCDLLAFKACEAGIELSLRSDPGLPDIVGDKRAFKQILLNLLSNAIKFSDRGAHIAVDARIMQSDLVVTVKDTGIGISADDLARIGDPFFQAGGAYDRSREGTGLGLSIVKGLIDLHRGRLEINSRLGHGTCVTVRLPVNALSEQGASNVVPVPIHNRLKPPAEAAHGRVTETGSYAERIAR